MLASARCMVYLCEGRDDVKGPLPFILQPYKRLREIYRENTGKPRRRQLSFLPIATCVSGTRRKQNTERWSVDKKWNDCMKIALFILRELWNYRIRQDCHVLLYGTWHEQGGGEGEKGQGKASLEWKVVSSAWREGEGEGNGGGASAKPS